MFVNKKIVALATNKLVSGATLLGVAVLLTGLFAVNSVHAQTAPDVNFEVPAYTATSTPYSLYCDAPHNAVTFGGVRVGTSTNSNSVMQSTSNGTGFCNGSLDKGNFSSASTGLYVVTLYTTSGAEFSEVYGYINVSWDSATEVLSITPDDTINFDTAGFSTAYDTKFESITITGTSTINIDVGYFLAEGEIDTTISELNPTLVQFQYDNASGSASSIGEAISNTTFGSQTVDTDLSGLPDGQYDLIIRFSNLGVPFGSPRPFPLAYAYSGFTVAGGVLTTTVTPEFYDTTSFENPATAQPCSITEIGGCINNSMRYLFYPSSESVDAFMTTYQTLETKIPFVYLYQSSDLLTGLYTGSAGTIPAISVSTGIGDITFISEDLVDDIPFVPLVRTLIGAGLWLMLFTTLYRKTLKIHDTVTV